MRRYYCPHCGARRLAIEIDRRLGVDPLVLVCQVCGFRLYGETAVRDLVARQDAGIVNLTATSTPPAPPEDLVDTVAAAPEPVVTTSLALQAARKRGGRAVPCSMCGAPVWRRPWDVRASGSGHFYCCREHLYEHRRRTFAGATAVALVNPIVPAEERVGRIRRRQPHHHRVGERRGAQAVSCAMCGQRVWRRPWDVRDSKSGLFFCCRDHRVRYARTTREQVRLVAAR